MTRKGQRLYLKCCFAPGSGSGSSGGVGSAISTLQATKASLSPKAAGPNYYFSSLPRGLMGNYNSLGRPATLPRQPLHQVRILLLFIYYLSYRNYLRNIFTQKITPPEKAELVLGGRAESSYGYTRTINNSY